MHTHFVENLIYCSQLLLHSYNMHTHAIVVLHFCFLGIAYRNCLSNAQWDVAIDVSQCQTVELTLLDNRAQQLQEILNANTANDTRDLTVMFDIAEVQAVSEELTMLTDTSQGPILPMDVSTANDILTTLIRYTSRIKIHVY